MLRRIILGVSLMLLAGCSSLAPPDLDDICRGASRCTPQCGSVASGASPDCDPYQNGGRTRG
ncbi:MAG: hypothetical protein V4701_04055 [Pseudomonadota bacterium]